MAELITRAAVRCARAGPARALPAVRRCIDLYTVAAGRSECTSTVGRSTRRWSSSWLQKAPGVSPSDFAFAFDIDGVLLHKASPLPGASESLRYLQDNSIPYILLTNGGGKSERDRVEELSGKLGVGLTTGNFVQSHTPFRELAGRRGGGGGGDEGDEGLRYKTILVTGSDPERARGIAEGYGFRSVVTPADILAAAPDIWPFDPLMAPVYASTARPLPKPLASGADALDGGAEVLASCLKIDAIFVFNDPRDWALDTQLITDLLRSHAGYLGTYSRTSSAAAAAADDDDNGQPELFFSNPDLFWSTGYHLPRFGQGAFQAALRGVWARVTGGAELRCTVIGKPHRETYRFAERKLARHRADMLASRPGREEQQQEEEEVKKVAGSSLRTVYMVGDNPESDIAGANGYESELGAEWCSVLVRTGVWDDKRTGGLASLTGLLKPKMVADTVGDAVGAALKRERWKGTAFPGA